MIPGNNIYKQAIKTIKPQSFTYLEYNSTTTNSIGNDVPSFKPYENIKGSIQAVDGQLVQKLGLDWRKNYIKIYSEHEILSVDRNRQNDRVEFNNKKYQAESTKNWSAIDGWTGALFVEVDK